MFNGLIQRTADTEGARRKRRLPQGASACPPREPRAGRRGVALVMVLVLTTVLAAMASDLQNEASVSLQLSANARDQLQAEMHAQSAIELELFLLRFQSLIKSSLGNFVPIPLFELSTFLVSSDTMKGLLTEREDTPSDERKRSNWAADQTFGDFQGSFWIDEVVDENRKININKPPLTQCLNMVHVVLAGLFDDPDYDPLFERLGDTKDPIRNRLELIANITDWVDGNRELDTVCTLSGDTTQSTTPEDMRYNHLPYNANYKPKNGQFSSLAELRLVPGVNDAFMRIFGQHLTVWTDDTGINLNTADPIIIQAVVRALTRGGPQPGDKERFAKFMEEYTLMKLLPPPMNKLSKPVFLQLLEASAIKIDAAMLDQLERQRAIRFDDTSNVYRIKAVGRVGESVSSVVVVWRDDGGNGEIRYWREE
ncbi:MAG: general secretion pathway protein GspK [Deltaproteobacteria bacterium]|nr:general secretion pathway protein GspK [Deltaproteobacteria bacterium]